MSATYRVLAAALSFVCSQFSYNVLPRSLGVFWLLWDITQLRAMYPSTSMAYLVSYLTLRLAVSTAFVVLVSLFVTEVLKIYMYWSGSTTMNPHNNKLVVAIDFFIDLLSMELLCVFCASLGSFLFKIGRTCFSLVVYVHDYPLMHDLYTAYVAPYPGRTMLGLGFVVFTILLTRTILTSLSSLMDTIGGLERLLFALNSLVMSIAFHKQLLNDKSEMSSQAKVQHMNTFVQKTQHLQNLYNLSYTSKNILEYLNPTLWAEAPGFRTFL